MKPTHSTAEQRHGPESVIQVLSFWIKQASSPSLFGLPIMWYNSFPCCLSKFHLFQPSMYITKSNLTDTTLSEHSPYHEMRSPVEGGSPIPQGPPLFAMREADSVREKKGQRAERCSRRKWHWNNLHYFEPRETILPNVRPSCFECH